MFIRKLTTVLLAMSVTCASWAYLPTESAEKVERLSNETVSPTSKFLDAIARDSIAADLESISVTPDGTRLWSMQGNLSSPARGDYIEAAREFISQRPVLFNLPSGRDDLSLHVVRNESAAGGRHVAFQLMIDKYAVRDALIEIHFNADLQITLVHGSFPTVARLRKVKSLSESAAIARAKELIGTADLYEKPFVRSEYVENSRTGSHVSAYVVAIPSLDPLGSFLVTIDAETGEELSRTNEMYFAMEGRGSVYRKHPHATPLTVEPLYYLASSTLTGLYAAIVNPKATAAFSSTNTHIYDPSSTHFDEVNAYYHLNFARDQFAAMGFNRLDRPMRAVVHYGDKVDNAQYDSIFDSFGFGDGNQYYSFAREESIIYHEYSHAVMHSIVKIRNARESGAMNEGQADYFGSSFSDDPLHGEYVAAKAGKPYIRTLIHNLRYPQDIVGTVHKDGRIWAGALWDLRTALGRDIADRLIHGSHYYLKSGEPMFIDGVQALLTADANLFNGRYRKTVTDVMSRRGIGGKAYRGMVLDQNDIRAHMQFRTLHRD